MKSKYFFSKFFCIAVGFSILLITTLIPLEYNNISTLSFFDVQSSTNPTFQVNPDDNSVLGGGWGDNVTITLTVDDPSNGPGMDYSEVQTAYGEVEFNIDFDIQPGFLITMSDGDITKEHTVANIEVLSMDIDNETVSGIANIGDEVEGIEIEIMLGLCVEIGLEPYDATRYEITDASGNWLADFSQPGGDPGEEQTCDIDPWVGNLGDTWQEDEDGDKTTTKFTEARFRVYPDEDRVSPRNWTEGDTLTLTIDDPVNGEGIDYTYYSTAPDKFDLSDVLDIVPGFRLTMTDGIFIKAHVVTDLQVLSMDPESDQVSGLAAEGSEVVVDFWEDGGCNAQRYVTSVAPGTWTADFTEPGQDPRDTDICDIDEWVGYEGGVKQDDNDWDHTGANLLKGYFSVRPEDDFIEGSGWPEGITVTLTIDDPNNGLGIDYEDTQVSISTEDGTSVEFMTAGQLDIQPGFRVTMTDGNFIKAHVVTDLQVLSMDPVTDQVSGTATPNSRIRVRFWVGCNAVRDVTTDENGNWTADFSEICDIDAFKKMRGHASQEDIDWDRTRIDFPNRLISFGVFPDDDYTFSAYWPENTEVTIKIDDPGTTEKPDYTDTQISTKVDGRPEVEFNYVDEIDIQPGFLVTVTDGHFTKGHVVTAFEVLDVNTNDYTISGIAEPGSTVFIKLTGNCVAYRTQIADEEGVWITDFSQSGGVPDEEELCFFDESVSGKAGNIDDDRDSTNYRIRNNIEITALENLVEFGDSVQISAKFTDPTYSDIETFDAGTSDIYTAIWDWGDNSLCVTGVHQECSITEPPFGHSGTVFGSHNYNEPGVYTINLSISDNDDYFDKSTYEFIVIYNPEGGFVTGGGWIDSPEGAYLADPALSGKANFGFVSKYKKGTTTPTGETEFQFKAGEHNFHSSSYEWLVVTGSAYAKFKGTGSINGEGEYKFMLWAGDKDPDTFRIKIWYENNSSEVIVYDNGMDQEISGGNIVVHTSKK